MGKAENERKKIFSFRSIPTRPRIGISKKIAKNCKKSKNIIMALFQPRMGSDWLRLREKRKLSFRSIQSRPGIGISKKIAKKLKKLKKKKTSMWLPLKPKRDGTN